MQSNEDIVNRIMRAKTIEQHTLETMKDSFTVLTGIRELLMKIEFNTRPSDNVDTIVSEATSDKYKVKRGRK